MSMYTIYMVNKPLCIYVYHYLSNSDWNMDEITLEAFEDAFLLKWRYPVKYVVIYQTRHLGNSRTIESRDSWVVFLTAYPWDFPWRGTLGSGYILAYPPRENTIITMGPTLLGVHPIVPWLKGVRKATDRWRFARFCCGTGLPDTPAEDINTVNCLVFVALPRHPITFSMIRLAFHV